MPTEKLDEELSVATNFKSEAEGRKMLLSRKNVPTSLQQ